MLAIGGKGRGWPVDLRPRLASRRVGRLWIKNGAVGTSGAGEQFIEVDGRRYGHVIDPRTGRPAEGVLGASVITGDAATADALSTAFLIGGPELARRYCAAHPGRAGSPGPRRTWRTDGSVRPLQTARHWRC